MKNYSLIIGISFLLLASCTNTKKSDATVNDNNAFETEEVSSEHMEDDSFADVTKDFLEAVGMSSDETDEILRGLEDMEARFQDSNEVGKMLEGLIQEGLEREQIEASDREEREKRESGNMDDFMEAFNALNAEAGVEATIEKIKKVDSLTGKNSFEESGIDLDKELEKAKNTKIDPITVKKMTAEERQLITGFKKARDNVHSTKEIEEFETMIANTDLKSRVTSGEITPAYAENQKKAFILAQSSFKNKKRKAATAKRKFQELNPDLFFGDEAGMTYFGDRGKPVYLPLGKLSFADEVIGFTHPKNINRSATTTGEPDGYLVGTNELGNVHSLGLSGTLTVKFENNALVDVNGPDLYIFEMGAIEPTNLEISKDGKEWISVGKIKGGVAEVDIHKFVQPNELFYYVRLTDLETASALPGADVDAIAAIGAAMRLNLDSKVLFDTGKADLKPEGKEALKALVESISLLKSGNVLVEGHTDDVGGNDTNQKLSLARAKSVSSELKKLIPSSSFKWKEQGYGESKPLVDNDSDENRAKNRRVEVLVLPN